MKYFLPLICFLGFLCACQDKEQERGAALKEKKKQDNIFLKINQNWVFSTTPVNEVSNKVLSEWPSWQSFNNELANKPPLTIGAFRRKANTLSLRADALTDNVPEKFSTPEIYARIAVIKTKVNSLTLYMNLQTIPVQKVLSTISDINREMASVQRQMAEIVRKSQIPKEAGEEDMIRMLDTSRAIK
jgi:hypothetical protein